MSNKPVIILGAGATKACGGPLTDEILPAALKNWFEMDGQQFSVNNREDLLYLAKDFMQECFNVPADPDLITKDIV